MNAKDSVMNAGGFLTNTRSQTKPFAGGANQRINGGVQQPAMQQATQGQRKRPVVKAKYVC